jgi:hypothetical protein
MKMTKKSYAEVLLDLLDLQYHVWVPLTVGLNVGTSASKAEKNR